MFKRNKKSTLHRWHRYLGLFAGLFTLWITLSGIALNHSTELELDQQHLSSRWLLTGSSASTPSATSFKFNNHWVVQLNNRLYLNTQEITNNSRQLIGAASLNQLQVVATQDSLWLFNHSGELIEQIDWNLILPAQPDKLGLTSENTLAAHTTDRWYSSDEAMLSWQPASGQNIQTIVAAEAPQPIIQQLIEIYSGNSTTYEQVLLNLHSGRLFGTYGTYLVDLIALILATLAISGFTVWLKRWRT